MVKIVTLIRKFGGLKKFSAVPEAVMKELFKGKAEVSSDNQGQVVVYTGHSFDRYRGDVTCLETKEFLDS